jgi:hypothetical protein
MNENIILDGATHLMNDIKSMQLIPDEGSNPLTFLIEVSFANGRVQNFSMTIENVASFNAWISYMRTFTPVSKMSQRSFNR